MRRRWCKLSFRGDAKHRTRNLEVPGSRSRAPRNDGVSFYNPNTIFATISRWISDEPPKIV
jgi:hypothetical protein